MPAHMIYPVVNALQATIPARDTGRLLNRFISESSGRAVTKVTPAAMSPKHNSIGAVLQVPDAEALTRPAQAVALADARHHRLEVRERQAVRRSDQGHIERFKQL